MNDAHIAKIAGELSLQSNQVRATADLLAEGGTVPFISRYRKEATGSLDEVAITNIRDRLAQLAELDARREAILTSLEERELLTDELREQVEAAETLAVLEDIYLPYRPKRRTRATVAREKGLEPLAELLFAQAAETDPPAAAEPYVDEEKGVANVAEALAGARDIIAETVNEDQEARARMRDFFQQRATIKSAVLIGKEEEAAKYRDYFEWEEPVSEAPSHRILAMLRGEREVCLLLRVQPPKEDAIALLEGMFVKTAAGEEDSPVAAQVREAVHDGYERLLAPSMENETRQVLKQRADEEAIRVFADNLRQLLLASPLGEKNVMGIDPGIRTGCKVVCLDRQGKFLHTETVYIFSSEKQAKEARKRLVHLCQRYEVQAIAIGNGTGGRETETFVRELDLPRDMIVLMVNESGASVYSASEVAREEFPDQDVTVRGAVSIGRRLQDPLAELVKIDPKSIGVGQYQHDVDQSELKRGLDDVVLSCVNAVGVEVNTASKQLLTYVAGLGPKLAENVVAFRNEHGAFRSRTEVLGVPRLGPKAFEQAAGFLRVRDGENPLDASAVHPESYHIVAAMAADLGCSVTDLMRDSQLRAKIDLQKYVADTVGLPTLNDIVAELAKPGRDPRQQFESFTFAEGVEKIEDLKPGMKLPGIVTNVTNFGAFVDIGVHQDGLVHISELSDHFVSNPADVVKVQQRVAVTVLEVDLERRRIGLSMRSNPEQPRPQGKGKRDAGGNDKPAAREGGKGARQGKSGRRQERQERQQPRYPDTALGRAFRELQNDGH